MTKFETIFCVITWGLMNVLLVSLAFETNGGSEPTGSSARHAPQSTASAVVF